MAARPRPDCCPRKEPTMNLPLPTAPELLRADFDSIRMLLIST
ncbi:hypothetical protein DJFAAGMI_04500 [Comamonas sp. PE63]|uniref:Uncharacterized protein n=1 Tax=Comamonas brasiliensis TaxID=1812482 RepID=A0ABS5LYX4_9BURK|nr:hypothetical protein [Comamonas sp. PE63]